MRTFSTILLSCVLSLAACAAEPDPAALAVSENQELVRAPLPVGDEDKPKLCPSGNNGG